MSDESKTIPWVVSSPTELVYIGLHVDEDDAWQTALGWPTDHEIDSYKKAGWYAAPAGLTWKHPASNEAKKLATEIDALRAECSTLAAGACCLPNDGLSADEGGVIFCKQERKVDALRCAVEHAEYMAKAADRFFAAENAWQEAIMVHEVEDSEESGEALDAESESKSEARKALESAAYEFRKRAAKALGE